MARSTAAGVPAITRAGSYDASAAKEIQDITGQGSAQVLTGANDPISFPGTTIINSPGVDACTLVAPLPGPQPFGDDGKQIELFAATAFAHTVTAPTNAINVTKHLLTFTAAIGSNVGLQAWNGTWIVLGTPNGVTVS
jgi:hypothetical protein